MQSILHTFHCDLFSPAATHYSIPPKRWHELPHYLSLTMQFLAPPPGTGLPLHSTFLAARHQALHSLQNLQKIKVSGPCMCVGVSSQSSSTRKFCGESLRILGIFAHWLLHISPFRSGRPPLVLAFEAPAAASAKGATCRIGGYVLHPPLGHRWFRQFLLTRSLLLWGLGFNPRCKEKLLLCSFGPGRAAASGSFPASMLVCTHSPQSSFG